MQYCNSRPGSFSRQTFQSHRLTSGPRRVRPGLTTCSHGPTFGAFNWRMSTSHWSLRQARWSFKLIVYRSLCIAAGATSFSVLKQQERILRLSVPSDSPILLNNTCS
ncbi:hypothetical protein BT67DRAFT_317288 [Trichocladium antarcticum]|uniref:Uncharacterized protein n=1 Tax=Trichocladium antarcticum TaxID=1450529 RepID=A0AAN6UJY0_9PEZI|nr:hypothetical protein BT67DRAFT_317288 [Trichocladium antarcticum]